MADILNVDKVIAAPPKNNLIAWLGLISIIVTIMFIIDKFYGYGDFFGLARPKTRPLPKPIVPITKQA